MINDNALQQRVGDVCEHNLPLSIESDTSLWIVAFYMNLMKADAIGVVDKDYHCIGFVTYDDMINYVSRVKQCIEDPGISCVMRAPNMSVYLDDKLDQALAMMNQHKVDWVPVVDPKTQCFSGLICREDIEGLAPNVIALPKKRFPYGGTENRRRTIVEMIRNVNAH